MIDLDEFDPYWMANQLAKLVVHAAMHVPDVEEEDPEIVAMVSMILDQIVESTVIVEGDASPEILAAFPQMLVVGMWMGAAIELACQYAQRYGPAVDENGDLAVTSVLGGMTEMGTAMARRAYAVAQAMGDEWDG